MSQPVYLPWPFIPQDGRRNFFNPAPGLKAPQWTEPWIIADRRPTKRRRCEKDEVPAPAQPSPTSPTSPTPTSALYRSSQTNRVRKSYAGPRYVDQARFRPRVSDIGDHIIKWARCEVPRTLRGAHHRTSNYFGRACRIPDWLQLPRNLMDWLTGMRHEHLARRTKNFCRHIKGNKQTRILKDIVKEMRDEAQGKEKHKYQATVEDAENSEEEFPARKKQRPNAGFVLDEAEVDDEFELDVGWTPRQLGIVSGGPLNLRDGRGKRVRLVDNMPMVIACADGPVIVEEEGGRTLVRDGKDQNMICNEYKDENMSDDDYKTDDESPSSSSSDRVNSSGSYPGELQVPPSPRTTTILPWYLIPARIPKSSKTRRKNQSNASASKGGLRPSTRTKPQPTLNNPRPARPSRPLTQSQLPSRPPSPKTPSPRVTPLHITTSSPASPTLTPTKTSSLWLNAILNAKAEGVRLGRKRAAAAKLAAERRRRYAQILGRVKKPLAMTTAGALTSETAQHSTTKSVVAPPASSKDIQTRATSDSQPNASPPLTPLEARLKCRMKAWKKQSQCTKPVPQSASLRDSLLRDQETLEPSSQSPHTEHSAEAGTR